MTESDRIGEWFAALLASAEDEREALDEAYQQLENAGLVSKVTVHRYLCKTAGCILGTVVRLRGRTLARTKDYKLAPGTNAARSVESARTKNTLDGARHWPGHTFDVDELATWGDTAAMDMNCRHGLRTVRALDVLAASSEARPGHPGKPSQI